MGSRKLTLGASDPRFNCTTPSASCSRVQAPAVPILDPPQDCFIIKHQCGVCPPGPRFNASAQVRVVMYGCSGQHRSLGVQLAELFCSIHLKGADPSCLHRLGCKSSHTCVGFRAVYSNLPELQRKKPRARGASIYIHLKLG